METKDIKKKIEENKVAVVLSIIATACLALGVGYTNWILVVCALIFGSMAYLQFKNKV